MTEARAAAHEKRTALGGDDEMSESTNREPVLVRVSPEILEQMKAGEVEPVVILGVEEQPDGTHDMTLMTTNLIYENRKLREAGASRYRGIEPGDLCDRPALGMGDA